MDSANNRALVGMSTSLAGTGGWQFLDLNNVPPTLGAVYASPSGVISENSLIDPHRNLILSADETGDYQIVKVVPGMPAAFFQNQVFSGQQFDSSAEDCSNGIALAPIEGYETTHVYVGGLNGVIFQPNGTWIPPSQMIQILTESDLSKGQGSPGPIAVAQGTDTGVLGQEIGGNTVTAFTLYPSGSPVAIKDWVTCNLGGTPLFQQGGEPHSVTAYQSPGGFQFPAGDAIAVFGNQDTTYEVTQVAVVDLTQMLAITPRDGSNHGCVGWPNGTLPAGVVTFKAVP